MLWCIPSLLPSTYTAWMLSSSVSDQQGSSSSPRSVCCFADLSSFSATSCRPMGSLPIQKTQAVALWPVPTSVSEVRGFVGLCSYYRRFLKDFATVAAPLHELTKKNAKFVWSDRAQDAFESLKMALTTPPILAMPTDEGEFCLDTDASERSIGAVLS